MTARQYDSAGKTVVCLPVRFGNDHRGLPARQGALMSWSGVFAIFAAMSILSMGGALSLDYPLRIDSLVEVSATFIEVVLEKCK
jgi:hypothetical protein